MDRKLAMDDAPQNFGWILLLTKVPKIHPIWYSHPSLKGFQVPYLNSIIRQQFSTVYRQYGLH